MTAVPGGYVPITALTPQFSTASYVNNPGALFSHQALMIQQQTAPMSNINTMTQQQNSGLPTTVLDQSGSNCAVSSAGQVIERPSPSRSASSSSPAMSAANEPQTLADDEKYIKELQAEKDSMEACGSEFKHHVLKLLDQEISRVQSGGSKLGGLGYLENRDPIKYVDVYRERPIRLTVRVLVPVREHPKFNFVGKLLGPKGNSMKRLQEETMTKMAVLGRGSMRDKQKEEELRASNDPKYQHLHEELHVEITAFAPPAEAHARVAYALTEVRKYLIPDSNDEIRQEQMREMEILAANGADHMTIAAAMAAAAAGDPMKRAAALSAAVAAGMRNGANSGGGQSAFSALHQPMGAAASQVLRTGLPNGMRVPTISASPYLTTGAPLVRTAPQAAGNGVHKHLYTEEMLLEAAAASQAPLELKESVISSLANGSTSTTSSLLHLPSNPSTMVVDSWQHQQQQSLKATSSVALDRSKIRQQAAPYLRPN